MTPNPKNCKSPSSYPGIYKYPSSRDVLFQTGFGWLEGKRFDDEIGPYWRVHDKIYDLKEFIDKHPGGSDWIRLTKGTDITESFEIHHIVNVVKVESILAKYFVKDAKHPRNSPYTFKPDGFYKTLKKRIEPILKEVGTGSSFQVKFLQDLLLLSFITTSIIGFLTFSTFFQILAGITLALSTISAHSFFHQKDTFRLFYFDFSLLSSLEWRITHSISHHSFPNTILDAEISMFEPIFQFLPKSSKSWFARKGPIVYSHFIFCATFWLEFGRRIFGLLKGKQNLRPENLIVISQLIFFISISGDFWYSIKSWAFIHTVSSYVFLLIGLNAAHHSPEIFHDGDAPRPDPDFGLCQLDAVRERSDHIFTNIFVIMVTFGEHSLHHLFPTICYSKFPMIRHIFEKTLSEFSESDNFPAISQLDHFLGTFKQLDRTNPKPQKIQLKLNNSTRKQVKRNGRN